MELIAVSNHKGGVAKTTTAVNLGAALALSGRRVLVVDTDPQAHATMLLGCDPADVAHDLEDVIVRGLPTMEAIVASRIAGLDLLPASLGLARLDLALVGMARREDRIARALRPIADRYEFVVLDLPPSLSLTALSALAAATQIIAPVSADRLSLAALGTFIGQRVPSGRRDPCATPWRPPDHDDPRQPGRPDDPRGPAGLGPSAIRYRNPQAGGRGGQRGRRSAGGRTAQSGRGRLPAAGHGRP